MRSRHLIFDKMAMGIEPETDCNLQIMILNGK